MKILYLDSGVFTSQRLDHDVKHDLVENLKKKHRPNGVSNVTPRDVPVISAENPGILFTTVSRRHLWTALPPNVKIEVWNGRPASPNSIPEWALILHGVPGTRAKQLVRDGKVGAPAKGKYAGQVSAANLYLSALDKLVPPAIEIIMEPVQKHYRLIEDLNGYELHSFMQRDEDDVIAFDLETTGLDPDTDEILGCSISWQPGAAYYIPAVDGVLPDNLQALLANPTIPKVAHNAKFDVKFLLTKGVPVGGVKHDTQVMAYVLSEPSLGLKALGRSVLDEDVIEFSDIVGPGQTFADVPIEQATIYGCQDSDLTMRLFQQFYPRLHDNPELCFLYENVEMPLVEVLVGMEMIGAPVNLEAARKLRDQLHVETEMIENAMWAIAGQKFDPNKPNDLRYVLFDKLGLTPIRETKTGFSTDKFTLNRLREDHALVNLILEWRARNKLSNTYVDPLIFSYGEDEVQVRVHGQFNQTVTSTGRLSSSRPNLQNQHPLVRQVYAAPEGKLLLAADYSQQELRILAHVSGDPNMTSAFLRGEDPHQQTADLLKIPRKLAKNVNFGIPYGAGPAAIARQGKCTEAEARAMLDAHKVAYPAIWQWIADTKQEARDNGYVETLSGRRRYLPKIRSRLPEEIAAAEREAVNMPIQGTAADITKIAMNKVAGMFRSDECRLIMQVHDELVFEIEDGDPDRVEYIRYMVCEAMRRVGDELDMSIPLEVSSKVGKTWADLK